MSENFKRGQTAQVQEYWNETQGYKESIVNIIDGIKSFFLNSPYKNVKNSDKDYFAAIISIIEEFKEELIVENNFDNPAYLDSFTENFYKELFAMIQRFNDRVTSTTKITPKDQKDIMTSLRRIDRIIELKYSLEKNRSDVRYDENIKNFAEGFGHEFDKLHDFIQKNLYKLFTENNARTQKKLEAIAYDLFSDLRYLYLSLMGTHAEIGKANRIYLQKIKKRIIDRINNILIFKEDNKNVYGLSSEEIDFSFIDELIGRYYTLFDLIENKGEVNSFTEYTEQNPNLLDNRPESIAELAYVKSVFKMLDELKVTEYSNLHRIPDFLLGETEAKDHTDFFIKYLIEVLITNANSMEELLKFSYSDNYNTYIDAFIEDNEDDYVGVVLEHLAYKYKDTIMTLAKNRYLDLSNSYPNDTAKINHRKHETEFGVNTNKRTDEYFN